MSESPAALGYRMPAEWELHSATWLTWPHNPETWPGQNMQKVEKEFLAIVRHLAIHETTHIIISEEKLESSISSTLKSEGVIMDNIIFHKIPTNDSWIRDYGPNFIIKDEKGSRKLAANHWDFDSWGKKYEWKLDDIAGKAITEKLELQHFRTDIVLEGGAIDVNGLGTCITTKSCIMNPNRNNNISLENMEKILEEHLGISKIIWLSGKIEGDDTDGHIDNIARFVDHQKIVCAVEENKNDPNYMHLKANYQHLKTSTDQDNNPLEIISVPMPGYIGNQKMRLPASYLNFYISNKSVLVPVFDDPKDDNAISILTPLFPNREIIPIPSRTLIWGLGSVHCLTQQQPLNKIV